MQMQCLQSVRLKTYRRPIDMNAKEIADKLENPKSISDVARIVQEHAIPMLRYQADRISVLEANYEIQRNIVERQQDYIEQLEQGLRASIDLNKAQLLRKTTDA